MHVQLFCSSLKLCQIIFSHHSDSWAVKKHPLKTQQNKTYGSKEKPQRGEQQTIPPVYNTEDMSNKEAGKVHFGCLQCFQSELSSLHSVCQQVLKEQPVCQSHEVKLARGARLSNCLRGSCRRHRKAHCWSQGRTLSFSADYTEGFLAGSLGADMRGRAHLSLGDL